MTVDHRGTPHSATTPEPSPIGELVAGRYRITERIGEGGTGEVFAAYDESLGRHVAIKLPTGPPDLHEHRCALLVREARFAAKLRSDHVVRLIDLSHLSDGTPFAVMELVDGESLAARLDRDGLPPTEVACQIAIETCAALAEVHAAGMVHRDIKPDNLMLAQRIDRVVTVKLIDFGACVCVRSGERGVDDSPMGTPAYMGPEQILQRGDCDRRTDLWGLGMVLYEMLTGVLPFDAPTITGVFRNTLIGTAPPLNAFRPDLPSELGAVIMRCLEPRPADRHQDATSLATALAPFAQDPSAAAEVEAVHLHCRQRAARHAAARTPPVRRLGGQSVAAAVRNDHAAA